MSFYKKNLFLNKLIVQNGSSFTNNKQKKYFIENFIINFSFYSNLPQFCINGDLMV